MTRSPVLPFLAVTLLVSTAAALLLSRAVPDWPVVVPWLVAVSGVTLLTFGYDKLIAGREATRVPESVLLVLVLVGGTLGALVAMQLFRHKSSKRSFQLRYWGLVLLQLAAGAGWWWWQGRSSS